MRSVQFTLFTLLAASQAAQAESTINLTAGVSPISRNIYELHMIVFWICVVIGIAVFSVMFYAIWFHRQSRGAKPADFHSHTWLEITWTIIPVIILVLMAIPATKVLLNMNNLDKEQMTIKITGYQWKWHYEYIEDNVSFFSDLSTSDAQIHNQAPKSPNYLREVDHPLVVPVHTKIRLLITSNDVNHAWWVPDLGVKRDAISGFINEAWTIINKPGVYRGQCAELCGINHAYMPIVVVAMSEQGYRDWIAKQKGEASQDDLETNRHWTMQELMARGEQVYSHICAACHQPGGVGLPPTFPALKGDKITTGPIAEHLNTVFNGRSGTAMQAFKNQLSDVELASVITYERNAWGNNTGTLLQPIQVKAYRDGKPIDAALATQPSGTGPTVVLPSPANPQPGAPKPTSPVSSSASTATAAPTPSATPAPSAKAAAPALPSPAAVSAPLAKPANQALTVPPSPDELKAVIARGEKIYLGTCAACHQPSGSGMPPTFPALKGSPIATGPVADHINRVMNGKPGTAMVPFKDQMNDQDIADVITYERNAWGNNTGTIVRPQDIQDARQQAQSTN